MLNMFDGEQKISNWPEDARKYIQANPNNKISISQSAYSKHQLTVGRLHGKRMFIGYNPTLRCFVAWNVLPNIAGAHRHDTVELKLSTQNQRIYRADPKFSAFYEMIFKNGKPTIYQKICVFPESDFIDFYCNFATYMQPNAKDLHYQTPAADFNT